MKNWNRTEMETKATGRNSANYSYCRNSMTRGHIKQWKKPRDIRNCRKQFMRKADHAIVSFTFTGRVFPAVMFGKKHCHCYDWTNFSVATPMSTVAILHYSRSYIEKHSECIQRKCVYTMMISRDACVAVVMLANISHNS